MYCEKNLLFFFGLICFTVRFWVSRKEKFAADRPRKWKGHHLEYSPHAHSSCGRAGKGLSVSTWEERQQQLGRDRTAGRDRAAAGPACPGMSWHVSPAKHMLLQAAQRSADLLWVKKCPQLQGPWTVSHNIRTEIKYKSWVCLCCNLLRGKPPRLGNRNVILSVLVGEKEDFEKKQGKKIE